MKDLAPKPREVAVAIPYDVQPDGSVLVCLVSSRKHDGKFVLPKGGVEKGEESREAALREMWEEAGLRPIENANVKPTTWAPSSIRDHKAHPRSPTQDAASSLFVPRAIYTAHEIAVRRSDELERWPEEDERKRSWVSLREAGEMIAWRRDIAELLSRSSLGKDAK